mmetsp:Transcript_27571/g.26427  ORF Transcript_27571/g.26427 Transcript_27571/m.26427 type:complete len:222 (-) Transcript_27571:328-993(-)|eukprot:CAMPEP_0197823330 /NCGR_PEP_ID=MMETSP1437-20131217/664_1 /TAXON_ID=49252 ORGANISM="Eucampia antarctica, Strain CCMP1452" /NCGR_SAMPLE_ID=MMETSP1437 /ASSEMBLY_ACC=CAM_ASM_001096 /LENGTH=221 /DNA_ID=CAMNT_0043422437 /DNA_START=69 /DNA_END=734 /DNA_ORIENTATION=-
MKTSSLIFAAAAVGSANAFVSTNGPIQRPAMMPSTTELYGGSSGYATTKEGKLARVATVKGLLENSEMIFSVPASGLTVSEVQSLRKTLPEGSTISVIKNKLMAKAVEDTEFTSAGESLLKGANMWFFVEEDISGTLSTYKAFLKKSAKLATHPVNGGVMEGVAYDESGIDAISKLPSKLELITRVAGGIKAVPTKLARVVNEPGSKLARAIKLATESNEE